VCDQEPLLLPNWSCWAAFWPESRQVVKNKKEKKKKERSKAEPWTGSVWLGSEEQRGSWIGARPGRRTPKARQLPIPHDHCRIGAIGSYETVDEAYLRL